MALPFAAHTALVAGLSARPGQARIRTSEGNYKAADAAKISPTVPYAIELANAGQFHTLVLDFDAKNGHDADEVEADRDNALELLDLFGIDVIEAVSGPNGGIHLWIPLLEPMSATAVKALASALAGRFTTLDTSMLLNASTGACRPPGAAHHEGGRSELRTPLVEAERIAAHRNEPHRLDALAKHLGVTLEPTHHLSNEMFAALRHGHRPSRYASRSELVCALFCSALNRTGERGADWVSRQLVDQRNVLAFNLATEPRQDGSLRSVEALVKSARRRAERFVTENPAFDAAGAAQAVAIVRAEADLRYWKGRTGLTDLAALAALCDAADRAGGPVVDCSERDLAEAMAVTRQTARKAQNRLVRAGWLKLVRRGTTTLASTWRLKVPAGERSRTEAGPNTMALIGHDAFAWRALGKAAAAVVAALAERPGTANELAERTGLHPGTVRRSLNRLRSADTAVVSAPAKRGGSWALHLPADGARGPGALTAMLDEVAEELGARAWIVRLRSQHVVERRRWRDYAHLRWPPPTQLAA